ERDLRRMERKGEVRRNKPARRLMQKTTMWKVADAKNKFSELLDTVDNEGPQDIQRRGTVYQLTARPEAAGKRNRLVEIITSGPSWEGVDTEGIPGKMREIDL